jgi:hypothetical protein
MDVTPELRFPLNRRLAARNSTFTSEVGWGIFNENKLQTVAPAKECVGLIGMLAP